MSDILRMRLARAPQRLVNRDVLLWPGAPEPHAEHGLGNHGPGRHLKKPFIENLRARPALAKSLASAFIASKRFAGNGAALAVPVRELDLWLVEQNNHATPADTIAAFEKLAEHPIAQVVSGATWRAERQRVWESLLAALIAPSGAAVGSELTRLLLVFGLVESLAQTPSPITDADAVERALRFRSVAIPKEILALIPRRARLARRYGFADLYVVRDEWNRYEPGEIAHIENILPHESKKRSLGRLSETEVTTVNETETVSTEEHDSQTTDRMELQQHSQTETDLAVHLGAQVEVQASYGPMQISATADGSFDYSQKDAEERAYQQSHEIVTRAVTRVEQRVKTTRTTRSLQRTTENNKHALNNETDQSVVGIYRWVDKVQRLQIFRYPHRLLLEFEIPEPAAYLTWRRSQPRGDFLTPEPVALIRRKTDFTPLLDLNQKTQPLQANDITETNYQWWVAQYNVMGVTQPPPQRVSVSTRLELKEQVPGGAGGGGGGGGGGNADSLTPSVTDRSMFDLLSPGGGSASEQGVTIPQGYRLESWEVSGYTADARVVFDDPGYAIISPSVDVTVGQKFTVLTRSPWVMTDSATSVRLNRLGPGNPPNPPDPVPSLQGHRLSGAVLANSYPATSPVAGTVQIVAHATMARECVLQVTLHCLRTDEALSRWQQQTYEQISQAYWALKRQRADEEAMQSTGEGVEIKGDSPARNKEVIAEELKRAVIEMLTGDNFKGRNAMKTVAAGAAPQVDLDAAISVAEEIQFIEQAFEWENLTYVLYPYFWAKYDRWPQLADVTLADEEFARFLRSGSARVVVPARPKFENQVRAYVDFGVLWGGGPVPTVNDPDYLSVAAEIMAQQLPPDDGTPGRSWEVRLPTTLVWLDDDNQLPKVNPSPALDAPPGQGP